MNPFSGMTVNVALSHVDQMLEPTWNHQIACQCPFLLKEKNLLAQVRLDWVPVNTLISMLYLAKLGNSIELAQTDCGLLCKSDG